MKTENKSDKTLKTRSYTAASSIPIKTAINRELERYIDKYNRIPPVHMQINPTNICNLKCDFCSCAGRNKSESLDFEIVRDILNKLEAAGTKAVTITGGGEPLMYKHINELLYEFLFHKIKIGLVTNGTQFTALEPKLLRTITWCRISHSDKREFDEVYKKYLESVVNSAPDIDWAFSIVVSGEYDKDLLHNVGKAVQFANERYRSVLVGE